MSELELTKWKGAKNVKLINSTPNGTMVFIYYKVNKNDTLGGSNEIDISNEFFIKRQLGLDEEEQFYEDTNGYLEGIGKNNDQSITSKRIVEIISLNYDIVKFILKNLHNLYWRDFEKGVISTINPNQALK
jgi:hypothetical protein